MKTAEQNKKSEDLGERSVKSVKSLNPTVEHGRNPSDKPDKTVSPGRKYPFSDQHTDSARYSDPSYSGFKTTMSDKIFRQFSTFVKTELGINMPEAKKVMLQARLQKRLRKLGINTFEEYYEFVFSPRGMKQELANMIDVITTNKTDFFREPKHFDYMSQLILPELMNKRLRQRNKKNFSSKNNQDELFVPKVMIWSAGCSSGEEAYTLAMVLAEFAERCPGFHYAILGTDISTRMLKEAYAGIYTHEKAEPIPLALRKKYLLKSKDKNRGLVRIIPELRASVTFRRVNFMENDFGIREMMDIVFCRNVLIYFARPTQELVLNRICRHLKPGGYIFMGHSETLNGLNLPLVPVTSTVYKKPF